MVDGVRKLALLIDADNAQQKLLDEIISVASLYGRLTIRRAYGDWKQMSSWEDRLIQYAIKPMHQINYVSGKNATDIALVIDAMDLLHEGEVDGFCVVSSDSDFTGLCMRLRRGDAFVMGIGRRETSDAFVQACDVFVFTDEMKEYVPLAKKVYRKAANDPKAAKVKPEVMFQKLLVWMREKRPRPAPKLSLEELGQMLRRAYTARAENYEWILLAELDESLAALHPEYAANPRRRPLIEVVRALDVMFQVREDDRGVQVVRLRPSIGFMLKQAYLHQTQTNDWVMLSNLGNSLHELFPHFAKDPNRNNLLTLLQARHSMFELRKVNGKDETRLRSSAITDLPTMLKQAYLKQTASNGWVSLAALGNALHDMPNYRESRALSKIVLDHQTLFHVRKVSKGQYEVKLR